jgi:hypothetical protein
MCSTILAVRVPFVVLDLTHSRVPTGAESPPSLYQSRSSALGRDAYRLALTPCIDATSVRIVSSKSRAVSTDAAIQR